MKLAWTQPKTKITNINKLMNKKFFVELVIRKLETLSISEEKFGAEISRLRKIAGMFFPSYQLQDQIGTVHVHFVPVCGPWKVGSTLRTIEEVWSCQVCYSYLLCIIIDKNKSIIMVLCCKISQCYQLKPGEPSNIPFLPIFLDLPKSWSVVNKFNGKVQHCLINNTFCSSNILFQRFSSKCNLVQ